MYDNSQTIRQFQKNVEDINKVLQEILDLLGRNKLIVNFDTDGGGTMESITLYKDQSTGILPVPFKAGYDFNGWFLSRIEIPPGSGNYEYSYEFSNLTTVSTTGALTLYAKWTPSWLMVRLNANNGTVQPETILVQYLGKFADAIQGDNLPNGLPTPKRSGNDFNNWYVSSQDWQGTQDDSSFNIVITDESTFSPADPTMMAELSASWSTRTFNLSFDVGNATGSIPPISKLVGSFDLSGYQWAEISDVLDNPGFNFKGWSKTPRAEDIILKDGDGHYFIDIDKNTTVFAIWDHETYYIDYYDLSGMHVATQKTAIGVPDYLMKIADLTGKFNGFNHWNSENGSYADYLKLTDGDLIYNLTLSEDYHVGLSASTESIVSTVTELTTTNINPSHFSVLSVGTVVSIPERGQVKARFKPISNPSSSGTLIDVTDAIVISPAVMKYETDTIYLSFKYDGSNTLSLSYPTSSIPVAERIQIIRQPDRLDYSLGDNVSIDGIQVAVISSANVASALVRFDELVYSPQAIDNLNTNKIEIKWNNFKTYQPISVDLTYNLSNIFISQLPFDTHYRIGEDLDTTGLKVKGLLMISDGDYQELDITDKCEIEPTTNLQIDESTISVSYRNIDETVLTTTFRITIAGNIQVEDVSIENPPTKRDYAVGESFDPSGMELAITYNTGDTDHVMATTENCSFTPDTDLQVNDTEINVRYLFDNDNRVEAVQSITVAAETTNYLTFKVNSSSIVLNSQSSPLTKYVKYKNTAGIIRYLQTNDASKLSIDDIKITDSLTCYYVADKQTDLDFTDKFLTDEYQSCLENVDFSNMGNVNVRSFKNTFNGCSNLNSITLPSSILTLYEKTFYGCTSLNSLTFGSDIYIRGESVFENCTNLNAIDSSNKIKSLNDRCFLNCTSLTSLDLTGLTDTMLYPSAFYNCSNLVNIDFGSRKFATIGNQCFYNDGNLTSTIMASYETFNVGQKAFYNCLNQKYWVRYSYATDNISFASNAFTGSDLSIDFLSSALSDVRAIPNYPWGLPTTHIK